MNEFLVPLFSTITGGIIVGVVMYWISRKDTKEDEAISSSIKNLAHGQIAIENRMDRRFDSVDARFEKLEMKSDAQTEKISEMKSSLSVVAENQKNLSENFKTLRLNVIQDFGKVIVKE